MVANALLLLSPLAVASTRRGTKEAVRRLTGAHDSINDLFGTLHSLRDAKIKRGVPIARLSHGEVDILRSALVFSGAGLDAVLKQLTRDALPTLLSTHTAAQGALREYSGRLNTAEPTKAKSILMSLDPTKALRDVYMADLTKGSLQGHKELIKLRKALGLPDSGALADTALSGFSDFFIARNQVVHELDLLKPTGPGTFSRRTRRMKETQDLCDAAVKLAGDFIVATESYL
ncbi:hypothetical protein AB0N61_00280 [Microbacterium sp. NPDC089320]|uniref:hypothetical protein n=1 Tax=Microbacterium sp. NPDC089320 TaxID=3155182 RepID=UPI003431F324